MADPVQDSASTSTQALLLIFSWGDPAFDGPEGGVRRYARWSAPIIIGDEVFLPEESFELSMQERQGGARDDDRARVTMPARLEPAATVMTRAHAPITVTIETVDPADPAATRRVDRVLEVETSARRPGGRDGLVRLFCKGVRSRLDGRIGLPVLPTCVNTLGDHICEVELDNFTFPATVDAVERRTVTSLAFADHMVPTVGGVFLPSGWLRFGKLRRGGLSLGVADHDDDQVLLFDEPPPEWVGQEIEMVAGCNRTIEFCRSPFANEERFLGLGIALPAYNPVINAPPE